MGKPFCLLWLILFGLTSNSAHAVESTRFEIKGVILTAEPIVGYAFDHAETPTAHVRGTFLYGAKFTAGVQHLAGEVEYTKGAVREYFTNQNIKTEQENIKIGLRSSITLLSFLNATARAGGQGSAEKIQDSVNGDSSPPWQVRPYAGAGIEGVFGKLFSMNAEANYIFNSLTHFSQNDIQTTLAFKILFDPKLK